MGSATPIFDELHRQLDAPPMKFVEPDGGIMCYGVRIFTKGGKPFNYVLRVQGTSSLTNFPVVIPGG